MSVRKKRLFKLSEGCAAVVFSKDGKSVHLQSYDVIDGVATPGEYMASATFYSLTNTEMGNEIVKSFTEHLESLKKEREAKDAKKAEAEAV